jgi:uncharacterized membrane protein
MSDDNRRQPGSEGADRIGRMETALSLLLRWGVGLSLAIVLLGMVISFSRHPDYAWSPAALTQLTAENAPFPRQLSEAFASAIRLRGRGLVLVGVFLLVATPLVRVGASIVGFAFERDWTYVAITSTVLALVLLSFLLGKAGG